MVWDLRVVFDYGFWSLWDGDYGFWSLWDVDFGFCRLWDVDYVFFWGLRIFEYVLCSFWEVMDYNVFWSFWGEGFSGFLRFFGRLVFDRELSFNDYGLSGVFWVVEVLRVLMFYEFLDFCEVDVFDFCGGFGV